MSMRSSTGVECQALTAFSGASWPMSAMARPSRGQPGWSCPPHWEARCALMAAPMELPITTTPGAVSR